MDFSYNDTMTNKDASLGSQGFVSQLVNGVRDIRVAYLITSLIISAIVLGGLKPSLSIFYRIV